MKKTYRSLLACCVLAVVILACSVGSPKTDASPSATPAAQQVTAASAGLKTPEVEQPAELVGLWKTEDLRSPDNSWNTSYPVYFQFADTKQYVYHGEEAFTSNQPTDTSEIVYSNVADSTFVKKLILRFRQKNGHSGKPGCERWPGRLAGQGFSVGRRASTSV